MENEEKYRRKARGVYRLLIIISTVIVIISIVAIYFLADSKLSLFDSSESSNELVEVPQEDEFDRIENGIHLRTGLIEADGLMTVVNNCTNCHSAKLVIQNRMSKERWAATIRWMQATQNLWDLGANEEIIINYLVTNYPPKKKGRREVLSSVEWYELKN